MTTRNQSAFERWWASLPDEARTELNETACRRAFFAGFATGSKPENKQFAFCAGKRRVTVTAPNYAAARRKAEATLTKRVEAEGKSPPKTGWHLLPSSGRGASQ